MLWEQNAFAIGVGVDWGENVEEFMVSESVEVFNPIHGFALGAESFSCGSACGGFPLHVSRVETVGDDGDVRWDSEDRGDVFVGFISPGCQPVQICRFVNGSDERTHVIGYPYTVFSCLKWFGWC